MSEKTIITLEIGGEASGAVAATQQVAAGLGNMGQAAQSATSGVSGIGAATQTGAQQLAAMGLAADTSSGHLRAVPVAAASAGAGAASVGTGAQAGTQGLEVFGQSASRITPAMTMLAASAILPNSPLAALDGNAGRSAQSLMQIVGAAALGGSAFGPLGAAAFAGAAAIREAGDGSSTANPKFLAAASAAIELTSAAGGAAVTAQSLGNAMQAAKSAADGSAIENLATAYAKLETATSAADGSIASVVAIGQAQAGVMQAAAAANDVAAQAATKHASAAQMLAASQDTLSSRVLAVAGGLGQVGQAFESATESAMRYQAASGTYSGGTSNLPGMAVGGPVSMGRAYMVGERGPELFMPGRDGTIIPHNALTSASGGSASPAYGGGGASMSLVVNVYLSGNIYGLDDFDRRVLGLMRRGVQEQTVVRGLLASA